MFCAKSWCSSYCFFSGRHIVGCHLWPNHGPCVNEQTLFPAREVAWEWYSFFLVFACVSYCCAVSGWELVLEPPLIPHTNAGEGRAASWIPVLSAASLLFNVCLYFLSSLLSQSNGVLDQKECTAKIETHIYTYKCPSLPAYIREKHLHIACENRNNLVFDCTSGFPKCILIRHSGNIMVLLPREGFHFYYFCSRNCSGSHKIRNSN